MIIEWNGNLDVLHYRLKETIINRAVPLSLILEVEEIMLAREVELLEQPTIDAEQPTIDEEQQDYESEVDLDECSEDTDIAID